MRRGRRWACVAAAVAALLLAAAAPAQAAGYRYWSYWLRSGDTWTYAQTGPALHIPADGSVEGWRFAVSRDAAAQAVQPRGAAGFAAICANTPAARGTKRVALVIDPGTAADAPGGATPPAPRTACARVPADASSADALAAVARPLRYDSAGILCAISGYPVSGCGEQVAASGRKSTAPAGTGTSGTSPAAGTTTGTEDGGGPSAGLYAGIGAVVLLAAGAGRQTRRRRRS
ncbi:SCO2322 family protein [Streptomyces sp. NBC_01476]|uniref:SCO2322 family protein n=1 Tax=Streptomyces sp. NBC_01476 TaxID=2903881 RepID=UPI002E30B6EC|nr:SCO2322 family protein [Streptomyces sp. NBC_01476]